MSKETVAKHAHLIASRKASTDPHLGTAQLTYFIFEGVLTGFIDDEFIHESAFSGGAAGSRDSPKTKKHAFIKAALHTADANNPYSYALQENDKTGTRGGPIPPGSYQILPPANHPKLRLSAKLVIPSGMHQVNLRDGFYIHGQGPKGSDGCIVLPGPEPFQSIMTKLKKSQGGHLQVLQAMESAFV